MTESNVPATTATAAVVGLDPNSPTVAAFAQLARTLPATGGDGGEAIIAAILNADSVTDLDAPWSGVAGKALLNTPIEVHEVSVAESDYADGLGVFLVVKGYKLADGTEFTFTTGSISVVAQLVKAYAAGWMPLRCRLVESDRPSKNGYHPQHLVIDPKQA